MKFYELFILAVGLSMDAFAVAVCKGLAMRRVSLRQAAWVGLWFGGFQFLMPLLGFLLANSFAQAIASFDHWIAFLLLAVIGGNMVREALSAGEEEVSGDLSVRAMFLLAIATSIDALAAGISLVAGVSLPLLVNGLFAPDQGWFPRYAGGLYEVGETSLVISRGLSYYPRLPRVFNPPEVVVIDVEGTRKAAQS